MSGTATLTWFAGHEFRLAWRDWLSMMTAGKRGRERVVAVVLVVFIALMHLFAWTMVAHVADIGAHPDKAALVGITGCLLLSFSLMLSQAMESVTRAFYARSDLELILSSPVETARVFAVRIGALSVSTALLGLVLAAPVINVLAVLGGAHWLAAYGVVAAMGFTASALAVALTVALFRAIGPKRTRLVAQIVAAVIGAAFVIGLQVAAILSYGTISRFSVLESAGVIGHAPALASWFWLPAARRAGRRKRARGRRRRRPRDGGVCRGGVLGARSAITWWRHRASPSRRGASARRRPSAAVRRSPRCGRRNGRCSGAIPGWCRRR